jgi:hypothetical protein
MHYPHLLLMKPREGDMLKRLVLIVTIAGLIAGPAAAIETRVRLSEGIKYNGFVYSGKHWLSGQATEVSGDMLVLRITKGGGLVKVPLSTVTEVQIRDTPDGNWHSLNWPDNDIEGLRSSLGLPAGTASLSITHSGPSVAYIEDNGTEVLTIGEGIPATITHEVRTRLGLFSDIANFESAQYLRLPDGTYSVRLTTYDESGVTHTVFKPVSVAGLRAMSVKGSGAANSPIESSRNQTAEPSPSQGPHDLTPSQAQTLIYGGGAYHFVPDSEFSDYLKTIGLDLSGANTRAGSIGAMFETRKRSYVDVALVVYGAKDRQFSFGQTSEADFSVKSVEAAWHRVLVSRPVLFSLFTCFGAALVQDERQFGGIVGISDEITAWPYSVGMRLISSSQRKSGFAGFVDARYRWLALKFRNSATRQTAAFELGGLFLQLGVAYGL